MRYHSIVINDLNLTSFYLFIEKLLDLFFEFQHTQSIGLSKLFESNFRVFKKDLYLTFLRIEIQLLKQLVLNFLF